MRCTQGERQPVRSRLHGVSANFHPPLFYSALLEVGAALQSCREEIMVAHFDELWVEDRGQDIAEYAVMLAVILVIVVATVRLIGGNANNVFSTVASSITQ
jgi:Flp pilus assembly pilin Flp